MGTTEGALHPWFYRFRQWEPAAAIDHVGGARLLIPTDAIKDDSGNTIGDHQQITNVGIVYYAQFKVTGDTGTGPIADELLAGDKDRVFGVGAEINVFLPKSKLLLGARLVPEFGARNRIQGITFLLTVGYQAKSLVRIP